MRIALGILAYLVAGILTATVPLVLGYFLKTEIVGFEEPHEVAVFVFLWPFVLFLLALTMPIMLVSHFGKSLVRLTGIVQQREFEKQTADKVMTLAEAERIIAEHEKEKLNG